MMQSGGEDKRAIRVAERQTVILGSMEMSWEVNSLRRDRYESRTCHAPHAAAGLESASHSPSDNIHSAYSPK